MDPRTRRIIETAVELAERDGFAAVRLRDVAARANVALGTVYRRFPTKESILIAALENEAATMRAVLSKRPLQGDTPLARVTGFFEMATKGLLRKPHLARALLRSVASADPDITHRVAGFHGVINALVHAALTGEAIPEAEDTEIPKAHQSPPIDPQDSEATVGFLLQQIWFASLVGWASGLHDAQATVDYVAKGAELLLKGLENQ